jgi:dipeptidyl aminopeptidase/acylaminoacyl peptidase
MAQMEPVALKARDGQALHGYLTRPSGKESARNLPLVVYVHGGPYGIWDNWDFDPEVQMLASRGYAVLQVNYRGSGGYGYDFMRAGYHEWGGKMQDDVTDATRWAIAQGIADAGRVCIYGASYGGYAALEGAVKDPDLYKCAIGYVGVYDLRQWAGHNDMAKSPAGFGSIDEHIGSDDADLWNRSPLAGADRIRAKVMLVVGGADARVPKAQGEAMRAALIKNKNEPEWVYEGREGHGFYAEEHVTQLYEKLLSFLDKQIGAARTVAAGAP